MPKDEPHRYTYQDPNILRLSRADQKVFANALINPPAPNQKLLEAFERYRKTKKGRHRSAAAFLRSFAKPPRWLKQCWADAKRSGLDKMTVKEINAEVADARRDRRQRLGKS